MKFIYLLNAISILVLSVESAMLSQETMLPDIEFGLTFETDIQDIGEPISEDEISVSLKKDFIDSESQPYNYSLYEGDIVLPDKDSLISLLHDVDTKGQLSAIRNSYQKWPNAKIPYVISSSFNSYERSVIARAFGEYHSKTCIRFVSRTNERDYVRVIKGIGCYSNVGRSGGMQYLSLGGNCVHLATVIHEFMHAVGFWHEQSRNDRDRYVNIYWQNILPGMSYNFKKTSPSISQSLGIGYDYSSVMHYGAYAFSIGGNRPTLQAKNGATLGNRQGFSQTDIQSINKLYGCGSITPDPVKPKECDDLNQYCSDWASNGQCTSNYKYMVINCRKSCNLCKKSQCVDVGPFCDDWSKKGECKKNPNYMNSYCKKSCNLCNGNETGSREKTTTSTTPAPPIKDCVDVGQYCADWARKGECTRNPAYMKSDCKKSCNLCGTSGGSGSGKSLTKKKNVKCYDYSQFCTYWAQTGLCTRNMIYMRTYCQKSCRYC